MASGSSELCLKLKAKKSSCSSSCLEREMLYLQTKKVLFMPRLKSVRGRTVQQSVVCPTSFRRIKETCLISRKRTLQSRTILLKRVWREKVWESFTQTKCVQDPKSIRRRQK